jgi:hypothetical protein
MGEVQVKRAEVNDHPLTRKNNDLQNGASDTDARQSTGKPERPPHSRRLKKYGSL